MTLEQAIEKITAAGCYIEINPGSSLTGRVVFPSCNISATGVSFDRTSIVWVAEKAQSIKNWAGDASDVWRGKKEKQGCLLATNGKEIFQKKIEIF